MIPRPTYPKIDRYIPNCLFGILQAIAQYQFGVPDFHKAYFNHSFVYRKEPLVPLAIGEGDALNIFFHRQDLLGKEGMLNRLEHYYGVRTETTEAGDFEVLLRELTDRFRAGRPVAVYADYFYVPGRRWYRVAHNPHMVCLYGFDPIAGEFLASDQLLGKFQLPLRDLRDCFDSVRESGRGYGMTIVAHAEEKPVPVSADFLARDLTTSLANLSDVSGCPDASGLSGLAALREFTRDLTGFFRNRRPDAKPFAIPGLWIISHEIAFMRKFLRKLDRANQPLSVRDALDRIEPLLSKSFELWYGIDMTIEKGLADGSVAETARIADSFPAILTVETEIFAELERLQSGIITIGTIAPTGCGGILC